MMKEATVEHIAIDLGSRESQICRRNAAGDIVEERRCATSALETYLTGQPSAHVVMETRTEAFRIADLARGHGHDVCIVPATLVRSLGVGQRGLKNDVRDARVLSEASCRMALPTVHLPSVTSREWKAICTSREALVKTRTQLISRVRSYLRGRRATGLRATPESLPAKVRTRLTEDVEGLPGHLERVLVVLECLNAEIARADVELKQLAVDGDRTRRLMTVPGVGPVTAVRFVAAVDRIERFPNAARLASYLGLIPGERTTGFRTKRTHLTRAGAPQVRWALGQAAWSLYLRRREDPMVRWAKQVAARRGPHVAITALARKLAHVLYALWKHATVYDPLRHGSASAAA
jgi:transposase